jgi:predicted AAA+ superfamily ATPase
MIGVRQFASWMRGRRALPRRFNPYVAGTPVFDRRLFFGRDRLARHTIVQLDSRSVKLTGERRIGKTSFLYYLHSVLSEQDAGERRYFPVFVDLEAVTAAGLFHALMEEMVEALALSPRTLAHLRFTSRHNGYQGHDFSRDLQRVVLDLRGRTHRQVSLVLLVDEVDAPCETDPIEDRWLDSLLEEHPEELRVVLAGVRCGATGPSEARRGHGALQELELEPFTPEEAVALVTTPVDGVYRYEPRAVERILQLSRLRPYLIQRLCLEAVNRMLDEGRTTVRVADVEAVRVYPVGGPCCSVSTNTSEPDLP